ncbi:MAG: ABC-2 transporter permease [Treponema sp.]|nr:ABC-2 transporter permease [Treponema sp.]
MNNFLNKEIKLCLSPVNYLFLFFSTMFIIPSYPVYVNIFYYCLSCFFIFNNAELNKDIAYSMILPITKKQIVKSRCILVFTYELVGILLTIPFAILNRKFFPEGNNAGVDVNLAAYGLILIPLSVFNLIFFTMFYKKAEKPGVPFFIASAGFWLCYFILEFPVWIKGILNLEFINQLDSVDFYPAVHLPVLGCGIVVFILSWIITYSVSAKRFEKADL